MRVQQSSWHFKCLRMKASTRISGSPSCLYSLPREGLSDESQQPSHRVEVKLLILVWLVSLDPCRRASSYILYV